MTIFNRSFIQYTKELSSSSYDILSKEEEKELLIEFSSGSIPARDRLMKAHLRFVVYILNRNFKIPSDVDLMDLVQEGNLGVLNAISKYDATRFNCRLFTYAQYYIKWYIHLALGTYDTKKSIVELTDNFTFDEIETDPVLEERANIDILMYVNSFLSKRESKIISLLFGLEYPFKPLTLKEVGSMVHLDSERVRQVKEEALLKIKEKKSFIDKLR